MQVRNRFDETSEGARYQIFGALADRAQHQLSSSDETELYQFAIEEVIRPMRSEKLMRG